MGTYPHIRFKRSWELTTETSFWLGQCDALIRAISEIPIRPDDYSGLLHVSLRKGAQSTTAIEGNTLTEDEIDRVAKGEHLQPSKEYQEIEVRNILQAMNAILREVAYEDGGRPISADLILEFHRMIGQGLGKAFDAAPGLFRSDARVVGRYRCPDHEDVPSLIDRLCSWLRGEFGYDSSRQSFIDAVIEAIVAHVYLEWIHPFGDGNGRTGRLVEFYVLLRAGNPDITSHILSNHYNMTRSEYYRQLETAGRTGDLTEFITYAVQGFRDGLFETLHTLQSFQFLTAWRSYIYDRFAEQKYRKTVFKRRRRLALEFPIDRELPFNDIFLCTPKVASAYNSDEPHILRRDLEKLVDLELLNHSKGVFSANVQALRKDLPSRRSTLR